MVIFISGFSRNSLFKFYPDVKIKKHVTILNAVDPAEFHPLAIKKDANHIISVANNWGRPEKRGEIFSILAKAYPRLKFSLLGNKSYLPNVNSIPYCANYEQLNATLNSAAAFVYLGFNDPAPKTVCQALNCELPLFLTNSGGNVELAEHYASYIYDVVSEPVKHQLVPELNNEQVINAFDEFWVKGNKNYNFPATQKFETLLANYFKVMTDLVG